MLRNLIHTARPRLAGVAGTTSGLTRRALHPTAAAGVLALVAALLAWQTGVASQALRSLASHPAAAAAWAGTVSMAGVALARTADVTLGVVRTVLVVSGRRTAAGVAASVETGVWLLAASQVLNDLTTAKAIGFCVGVGVGTIVGMGLVRAAKWGVVTVRVFVPSGQGEYVAGLMRARGLGATIFTGHGKDGPRDMVMSMSPRREAAQLADELHELEDSFVCVDSDAVVGTVGGRVGRV